MSECIRLPCGCLHNDQEWLALCIAHGHYRAHDVPVPGRSVSEPEALLGRSPITEEWLDE